MFKVYNFCAMFKIELNDFKYYFTKDFHILNHFIIN